MLASTSCTWRQRHCSGRVLPPQAHRSDKRLWNHPWLWVWISSSKGGKLLPSCCKSKTALLGNSWMVNLNSSSKSQLQLPWHHQESPRRPSVYSFTEWQVREGGRADRVRNRNHLFQNPTAQMFLSVPPSTNLWSSETYLISLCLRFLVRNMGIRKEIPWRTCGRLDGIVGIVCKTLDTFIEKCLKNSPTIIISPNHMSNEHGQS